MTDFLSSPINLAIAGIVFSLVGTWFVAIEVVNRFHGFAYAAIDAEISGSAKVTKNPNFERWETRRARWMIAGLALITIGSLLQIGSLLAVRSV